MGGSEPGHDNSSQTTRGRSQDTKELARSRTAVLLDRSSSTRADPTAEPGTRRPDWAATLVAAEQLAPTVLESGALSVAGFDGSRSTVDWDVDRATVPAEQGNETRRKDRRRVQSGCLEKRLRQLSDETPGTDRTDVLGALAAAADQLGPAGPVGGSGSDGARRIVVATDGLTNTGCADLRSAGFDGGEEIRMTVDRCRDAGELPDLTGTEVGIFGIGRSARGEAPSSPQTAWLTTLWEHLCQATGASSCQVAATARSREAGVGMQTVVGRAEPQVTFPALAERPMGRVTTIVLPGSVLFATDRSELSPTARSTLDDAASRIMELDPLSVAVSGHTDSRGSERRGRQLSLARARSVRSALAERGIAVDSVRGHSDDRPACTPEYRDGVPDHAAMACNRRVEIAVTVRR
ncbi:OmpA family protein [Streptomyces sp. NRRL F-5135]|uniref:OmpA family protein n=1 Tax=Streptomyces sp. NRRL F-5135 TaxID=1463858 RepID=UPI000AE6BB4E|nr:OmpA family protein [Streptomyces sp. NRRL F-5135]